MIVNMSRMKAMNKMAKDNDYTPHDDVLVAFLQRRYSIIERNLLAKRSLPDAAVDGNCNVVGKNLPESLRGKRLH